MMKLNDEILTPQSYLEKRFDICPIISGDDDKAFIRKLLNAYGCRSSCYKLKDTEKMLDKAPWKAATLVECFKWNNTIEEYQKEYIWFEF